MSNREIIIGDIHGCAKTFHELIHNILNIQKEDQIYLLGDYVDRGPRIKETIDEILQLKSDGYNINCLRGNHEQMLINSINLPKSLKDWLRNGGIDTLDSFCVLNAGYLDDHYIDFFLQLPFYYELEEYILVHAGMNFNISNPFLDTQAMLTTRNMNVDISKIKYKKMIVGHTPVPIDKIEASIISDKIMLDGGCIYNKKVNGLGYLVAFDTKSKEVFSLKNID